MAINPVVSRLTERLEGREDLVRLNNMIRLPTVTWWNRLEGRPRSPDLTRSLAAEVRDPLWMLARQWQLGEFVGADSGSPVHAVIQTETRGLTSLSRGNGDPEPYDGARPLEADVEAEAVEIDLMMGLHVGRRWLERLRASFGAGDPLVEAFRAVYAFATPSASDTSLDAVLVRSHRDELRLRGVLRQRALDGASLAADVLASRNAGTPASDRFAERFTASGRTLANGPRPTLDALAKDLAAWLDSLFARPAASGAWRPARLEYRFTVGAADGDGSATVLSADQYPGGRLDWYAFDVERERRPDDATAIASGEAVAFIPTPVQFTGMPSARWWEFESRHVGFGLTTAAKTDLVKMLLAQFGLVFSNDWFIFPVPMEVGTLADVIGLRVTDNFGQHTLIEPTAARQKPLGLAGRWGMWTMTRRGEGGEIDRRFFLAPALPRSIESKPLDEVLFLRDETANLVWAVEQIVPNPLGGGRDGRLAGQLVQQAVAAAAPAPPATPGIDPALPSYRLMTVVPEHWIPFVSVKLTNEPTSRVVLQGAMPRIPAIEPRLDGAGAPRLAHNAVLPRGRLLSADPVAHANVIYEEEILRGGALVRRTVQQARWHDGRTSTWYGRAKRTGRGEGASGLAFDAIREPPKQS